MAFQLQEINTVVCCTIDYNHVHTVRKDEISEKVMDCISYILLYVLHVQIQTIWHLACKSCVLQVFKISLYLLF